MNTASCGLAFDKAKENAFRKVGWVSCGRYAKNVWDQSWPGPTSRWETGSISRRKCVLTRAGISHKLWFTSKFFSAQINNIYDNLVRIGQILASNYDKQFFSRDMLFKLLVFKDQRSKLSFRRWSNFSNLIN